MEGGVLEAVIESSEICLMIIFMKGGGRHLVAILSFYTEYTLDCQSVHLSVCSLP